MGLLSFQSLNRLFIVYVFLGNPETLLNVAEELPAHFWAEALFVKIYQSFCFSNFYQLIQAYVFNVSVVFSKKRMQRMRIKKGISTLYVFSPSSC